MRRLAFALLLALSGSALAQQQLIVNGVPVPGLSTTLLPGTSYVPAEPYAQALGADYRFDPQTGLLLVFGGRMLSLASFSVPAQAAAADAALRVDGRTLPSAGAVNQNGTAYLPVKTVTAALGGRTAYLGSQQTVAVVFPRPQLLAAELPGVWGTFERFVLTFSAPVGLERFYEESLRVVRFRFPRAELAQPELAERRLSGSRFSDAAFVPDGGFVDFNLTLREGNRYTSFSEPFGPGERVVIDVFRDTAAASLERPRVLLEATADTLPLARSLQQALTERGLEVALQSGDDASQDARAGFAAPLLLALRQAPLAEGQFSAYYLGGEAAPLLAAPLRLATSAATLTAEGRQRLAQLRPDLGRGERLARGLVAGLERRSSLRAQAVLAAPLLELSGAAGRGVLLEFSAQDLADPAGLAAPLAVSLAALLGARP